MSEKIVVLLDDVLERFEEITECWEQYLNMATGEFVSLSDGSYIETDEELAEEIENSCDYLRLPNQRDIHEFGIMENFAAATPDLLKREKLFHALRGRKPFRRFKDTLNYVGLTELYYAFRTLALYEMAREWCEENHVSCILRN